MPDDKHGIGRDGLREDGVSHYPADAARLQSYTDARQALGTLQVPILLRDGDPHERLYVAAFDGTGSDADKDPAHATNVARIRDQVQALNESGQTQVRAGYVAGPGTQDSLIDRAWDGARGHTYDERLEQMYRQFIEQAKQWRADDPQVQIRVADIGFSRGAEQAAGFARLVHERGIQDPSGARYTRDSHGQITEVQYTRPPLAAPGQVAQAVGLFDPVGTGEPARDHDRRLPPSVLSGFQIIAEDERRGLFRSTHIIDPGLSADGRFLGVSVAGAHVDIGGGYHRDGLGVRSGNLMVDYLNGLSDTPLLTRKAEPDDPRLTVVHRSEEGSLLYRLGSKVDRSTPDGYIERLVPKGQVDKVEDPYNAETVDPQLRARFQLQAVPIGTGQDQPVAAVPPGHGHPDRALYAALREKLPASVSDAQVMHATVLAKEGGVTAIDRLQAQVHDGHAFVSQSFPPGYRIRLDLSETVPDLATSLQRSERWDAASLPPADVQTHRDLSR